jgi:dienelactone hydrolase
MRFPLAILAALASTATLHADDLADQIRALDPTVLPEKCPWGKPSEMLAKDIRARLEAANQRESDKWRALRSKDDWESYSLDRTIALGQSLHSIVTPHRDKVAVRVTGTHAGDGFVVDNIVFANDFGLPVPANLYRPAKAGKSHPGIVIVHSHHNGKSQGELQDMDIGWARQGAYVLIPDMFGHGERRVHPFTDESKYPGPFRPGRQDYYFRYNLGMQLQLLGESLMGWFVWDLALCVDVLLQQPGIDKNRIAMFGSVAGGGDPVAVTAALDRRIQVAAVFNFGGPQPESPYPLPADAETKFNYAGGGSWESTRNLRLSASEGFLPWVIVGSIAPRKLLYCHEFA